jgi:hypothetical protein
MADSPDRRFTDQQVALVLRTAAEIQEREGPLAAQTRGLTLAQLEQIGAEAGIEPETVRRAVARLDDRTHAGGQNALLGGPITVVVERTVPGRLDPATLETLLDVVRRVTGHLGESRTVGQLFGWRGRLHGAKTEVSVSSSPDGVTVRVQVELDELALAHHMAKTALVGVGGGLVSGGVATAALGPAGWLVGGALLAGAYLWARRGYGRGADGLRAHAAAVADRLAAVIQRVNDAGAGEVARRPPLDARVPTVSPAVPRS